MERSWQRWGFVAALALGRLVFDFQLQSVATLGPELVALFKLDYARLGSLIGLYMAPGILLALPGGLLGRRFGERLVVGTGLSMMALGGVVSAFGAGTAGIGAGRLVAGCGAVALIVMQGKMVADRFPGRGFIGVMGLLVGAFPIGAGLAGLIHTPVVRAFGWPGMFGVGAALAALSATLFLLTCGPGDRSGRAGWAFPSRRECILVGVAGLIWTFYNGGYAGFLSYLPSVLAARGHPPAMTAWVMLVATWCNLPATVLGGVLAGRIGGWPVFLAGSIAGVTAVAGAALLDWPIVWGLLFGTAAAIHPGVVVALGTLSARPENRAVGMGLFYTVYYVGGTVLPALCGRAADLAGDPSGALLAAAALFAMAIPAYLLHQHLQRRFR